MNTTEQIARECVRELEDKLNLDISKYGDHYAMMFTPERMNQAVEIVAKYLVRVGRPFLPTNEKDEAMVEELVNRRVTGKSKRIKK